MHGTIAMAKDQRRSIEIEALLQWAYRDELPKKYTSSAEGIWDKIREIGRGGIDPGHGAAQRYPHFGLPHPDALAIETAVSALPPGSIDWPSEGPAILGDLIGIAGINRPDAPADVLRRRSRATWTYHRSTPDGAKHGKARQAATLEPPRDVILVRTLDTAALVAMHAKMGTRPRWVDEPAYPLPVPAERGPNAKVIGECWGKNSYSVGSHCPLRWTPSPISIAEARADYLTWWRGLRLLAEALELGAHRVLLPEASEMPWNDSEPEPTVLSTPTTSMRRLPLNPSRPLTGPPLRSKLFGPVRSVHTREDGA